MIFMAIIDFLIAAVDFVYAVNLFSVGRVAMGTAYSAVSIALIAVGIKLIYQYKRRG